MGCLVHTVSCVGMASTDQRSPVEVSYTSSGKYSAKTSDNECSPLKAQTQLDINQNNALGAISTSKG